MQILYDNVDLNASPYTVSELPHESVAQRDIFLYELARERGAVIISSEYRSKQFVIEGLIKGTSQADLDSKIDTFKELISRPAKNLDVDYSGAVRRYKNCYAIANGITRTGRDITRAKYQITIVVPDGVGYASTLTTVTNNGITVASYAGSITIAGTAKPKPKFTITVSAVTGTLNAVSLQQGNLKIDIAQALVATDVLIIDTETKKVTLNGVEKDYTGQFPEFGVGSNSFTLVTNGTTRTYNLVTTYYPAYL